MKKVMKYTIRVVLIVILLVLLIYLAMCYQDHKHTKFTENYTDYVNRIQCICGVIQCDLRAKQVYGVGLLTEETKDDLRISIDEVLKQGMYDQYDIIQVVQLLVICDYFDLKYEKKLTKILESTRTDRGTYEQEYVGDISQREIVDENLLYVDYMLESKNLRDVCRGILEGTADFVNDQLEDYSNSEYDYADFEYALRIYALSGNWNLLDQEQAKAFLQDYYTVEWYEGEFADYLELQSYPTIYEEYVEGFDGVTTFARARYSGIWNWDELETSMQDYGCYGGVFLLHPLRYLVTFDGQERLIEMMESCAEDIASAIICAEWNEGE